MKLLLLAALGFLLPTVTFAQKKAPDPELRDKRAVAVDSHKSHPSDIAAPRKNTTSRDLERIERSNMQKMKTTHNSTTAPTRASATQTSPAEAHKNKAIKFSYRPPQASGKTSSNPNPVSAPVQPHKKSE